MALLDKKDVRVQDERLREFSPLSEFSLLREVSLLGLCFPPGPLPVPLERVLP